MIKSLAKGKESSIHHKIRKAKDENFTDLLCEFFDQTNEELIVKSDSNYKTNKLKFLLCLDNAEGIVDKKGEGKKTNKFLQDLLEKCKNIRIIITS